MKQDFETKFNSDSPYQCIALKAFMILPSILLQKPSKKSKAKEHSIALERRLRQWHLGELNLIMCECREIQRKLNKSTFGREDDIPRVFSKLMFQGKVHAAMRFLTEEGQGSLLNITDDVLDQLKTKHRSPAVILKESLLYGPINKLPETYFSIDENTVLRAAMNTRGSAGASCLDADQFRRILSSKNFSKEGKRLREEIALFAKKIATTPLDPSILEAYVANRLIPIDKKPGIRPFGLAKF